MAILDIYMFRLLLDIFRLSLRELKVLIYTLRAYRQVTVHPRSFGPPRNTALIKRKEVLRASSQYQRNKNLQT
jgi:hypothetical protein